MGLTSSSTACCRFSSSDVGAPLELPELGVGELEEGLVVPPERLGRESGKRVAQPYTEQQPGDEDAEDETGGRGGQDRRKTHAVGVEGIGPTRVRDGSKGNTERNPLDSGRHPNSGEWNDARTIISTPDFRPALQSGTFHFGPDLAVHRLGFGTMRLTGTGVWGEPSDRAEAIAVLRRAVELGINLIDTADSYGPEVAERLVAEALHPYPGDLVIATKAGFQRPGPGQWVEDGRPEHLREACDGSLRRLRLERIDLFQLHRIDPKVPMEEQIGTLLDLQAQGRSSTSDCRR